MWPFIAAWVNAFTIPTKWFHISAVLCLHCHSCEVIWLSAGLNCNEWVSWPHGWGDEDKDSPLWHSLSYPGMCVAPWFLCTAPDTPPGSDWGHLTNLVDELYTATKEKIGNEQIQSTVCTAPFISMTWHKHDRGKCLQFTMHFIAFTSCGFKILCCVFEMIISGIWSFIISLNYFVLDRNRSIGKRKSSSYAPITNSRKSRSLEKVIMKKSVYITFRLENMFWCLASLPIKKTRTMHNFGTLLEATWVWNM